MKKEIGYIGLGKMGFGMVENLLEHGYDVVVYDMNADAVNQLVAKGARKAENLQDMASKLSQARLVWVMVPHFAVDGVLTDIKDHLASGDTVIDGGNSPYQDSVRRGKELAERGIHFLDAGTSGGPFGARHGACVMVGGEQGVYEQYKTLFEDISAPNAFGYMGLSGAGHFVKMVHNGIEYGMMQAIGEGFEVLKKSEFAINLSEATRVYNNQSVIESRLIGWLENAYKVHGQDLDDISGEVDSTGEGAWTVDAAKRLNIPVPIIEGSLRFREQSHGNPSYTGKVVSALRNQFGGHNASLKKVESNQASSMEQNTTLHTLETFTLDSIPDLDDVVIGALERFKQEQLPKIDFGRYKRPLVVGSGNAEATGRIIFEQTDAIFASESNYESKLKNIPAIDGVILISASGAKHAPIIAKKAKELGKPVMLITNTHDSEAKRELWLDNGDVENVFPKNREPYTYNTSTYMGMVLGYTQEDAAKILQFIREHVDTMDFSKFASFDKYYVIVPTQFSGVIRMLQVKFIELFGRTMGHDVETSEYVKHATTVVPSHELFLSFGYENTSWGADDARINVPLPEWANYGAMIAISYYVIGKIQKQHPALFKQNIAQYTAEVSKVFGEEIKPIVG